MIGAVNDVLSWRWTFHILGIAGLVFVPVTTLAMWEPASVRNNRKARRRGKESYSIKVRIGVHVESCVAKRLKHSTVNKNVVGSPLEEKNILLYVQTQVVEHPFD